MSDSIYNANRHREQKFEGLFHAANIPTKEIQCYGNQIVVTCWSKEPAEKIATLLKKASFKIRGIIKSIDENKDQSKRKTQHKVYHDVYRVFACVEAEK